MKYNKKDHEVIEYASDYYNRRNMKETFDMPMHMHDTHEIYYLYEGNVQYNIAGSIYEVAAGSIIFTPKSVAHKTTAISLKHNQFIINFKDNYELNEVFEKVKVVFRGNCISVPIEKRHSIERIFAEIQKEMAIDDDYSQNCIKSCVYKLFVFIVRNLSNVKSENVPEYVIAITEYIEANYPDEISLPKISKTVGMNEAYLSRKFKEYTGTGITEYINIVRVREAVNLLTNTNFSIVRIANEVGYNDSSYFTMMFKRLMGITPKRYRKNTNVNAEYSNDAIL